MPAAPGSCEDAWKASHLFAEWSGRLSGAPARRRALPKAGLESQWVWAGTAGPLPPPKAMLFQHF